MLIVFVHEWSNEFVCFTVTILAIGLSGSFRCILVFSTVLAANQPSAEFGAVPRADFWAFDSMKRGAPP